jgi:predicted metal-dependent hydrolase
MARRRPAQLKCVPADAPAQLATRHQFRLGAQRIEYTLKRSRRRSSITFTIDEDGLRVGAPWRATQRHIESLLGSHALWIDRKLAEWQARRRPPFLCKAGTTVMLLGEPLTLALDPARRLTGRDGNRLCVAADTPDPAVLTARVVAWLRDAAQAWFEQRAACYAPALDVRVTAIRLSNAKTRWGTCHPDGRVHLNWRLIQMPAALIDYVVVHELAHLREPNHSRHFWRWVASILPDYEQRRVALRREGHRYLIA